MILLYAGYVLDMNLAMAWIRISRLSGRASQRGIRKSEVQFLMETKEFFSVPRPWEDGQKKHLSVVHEVPHWSYTLKEVHLKVVFGRFNSFVRFDNNKQNKQKQTKHVV